MRSRSSAVAGAASGMERRQVLVGQRVADDRVVGRVGAPADTRRTSAESGRPGCRNRVDPGSDANVSGVGVRLLEILRPELADEGQPASRLPRAGQRQPEQAKRVVLVVGVVEVGDLVLAALIVATTSPLTSSWPSIARIGPVGRVWAAAGARRSARRRERAARDRWSSGRSASRDRRTSAPARRQADGEHDCLSGLAGFGRSGRGQVRRYALPMLRRARPNYNHPMTMPDVHARSSRWTRHESCCRRSSTSPRTPSGRRSRWPCSSMGSPRTIRSTSASPRR